MDLLEHLIAKTPAVWVASDEPYRVLDDLKTAIEESPNTLKDVNLAYVDPFEGLRVWNPSMKEWVVYLNQMADGDRVIEKRVTQLGEALHIAHTEKLSLVLLHAEEDVDGLTKIVTSQATSWRHAYLQNNLDIMPSSLVMISHELKPPSSLDSFVETVVDSFPTQDDIAGIVSYVGTTTGTNKLFSEEVISDPTQVPELLVGLSESQINNILIKALISNEPLTVESLRNIKAEALRSGGILEWRHPSTTFDDIGGLDDAKDIIGKVSSIWTNRTKAKEMGIKPVKSLLMVGIPGTGKSALCEASAESLGLSLVKMGISRVMDKYIGESERKIRLAFEQIELMSPIVMWMDEFGRDMTSSTSHVGDSGVTQRVHGEFLSGIQELSDDTLFLAAANNIEHLPPEMLRAGRFDKIMFVGLPTFTERMDILKVHLPVDVEYDLEELSVATEFFTGAEIEATIREACFNTFAALQDIPRVGDIVAVAESSRNIIWRKDPDFIKNMYRGADEWEWASKDQKGECQNVLEGLPMSRTTSTSTEDSSIANILGVLQ